MMRNIVVIAASTGGLEPLRAIMSKLPVPCRAAIFVVWHIGPHPSLLPAILSSVSKIPATFAKDKALIESGHIYVAPPNHHVVLSAEHMHLNRGPKINHTRPAADPLFASAAKAHQRQVLGVVLSGKDGDGAEGLKLVKEYGGTALVQHPDSAEAPSMPLQAMMVDHPDEALAIAQIAERVCSFCSADQADGF
jgi:two-component system chemotaxis response regulator CheB